ncbi:CDP-alcohol phosphatidyltransferase family protein [Maridesulfovibrio ferrireducens]|uniref:CDP-alcohol phosphatidyltransferase family protein n=1 Tax=Maridesulfovibrio ferrireducens TaxID=246191 RepID=UPI001A2EED39|nr:CDP-alcohol phosphatidyltransferase family protein [Maridesulfovibrio ferrireducens]MBI9110480.1 CDP-alcohol phosphatidyltransferase family protein [Maridesulfovibrio ferrireducens]
MTRQKNWNIPNLITIFRILLTLGFVFVYLDHNFFWAWILFLVAGFSDALDGFLARILNQRTSLGAMLDPLADKFLIITSFLCLAIQGLIPSWLALLVILRDTIIVGGLFFLKSYGVDVQKKINPLIISKLTTALQLLLIFSVLSRLSFALDFFEVEFVLEWATALFTFVSGVVYIKQGFAMFFAKKQECKNPGSH